MSLAIALAAAALLAPAGASAAATCTYDPATATVQAQMLSPRVVVARAAGAVLVDGRPCAGAAATRRIVVASDFPPAADTVVVDESHGRLAPVIALTSGGGDTIEVIGTAGPDHFVAHDDVGASIDVDGDGDPDVTSTQVGRVVLRGRGGDDVLAASSGPGDRTLYPVVLDGGPGDDVLRGGRSGADRVDGGPGDDRILARATPGDRLIGGAGIDALRADAGDRATGFER